MKYEMKMKYDSFHISSSICPFKCFGSVSRQKCVSGVMDKLPNF